MEFPRLPWGSSLESVRTHRSSSRSASRHRTSSGRRTETRTATVPPESASSLHFRATLRSSFLTKTPCSCLPADCSRTSHSTSHDRRSSGWHTHTDTRSTTFYIWTTTLIFRRVGRQDVHSTVQHARSIRFCFKGSVPSEETCMRDIDRIIDRPKNYRVLDRVQTPKRSISQWDQAEPT